MDNYNDPDRWVGRDGNHPFDPTAENVIGKKSASEIPRPIRNALAHGNIVYINKDGLEREGESLFHLGFLSRYEEGPEAQSKAETYRLITATD